MTINETVDAYIVTRACVHQITSLFKNEGLWINVDKIEGFLFFTC
jgi:hypothetical protein